MIPQFRPDRVQVELRQVIVTARLTRPREAEHGNPVRDGGKAGM